MKNIFVLIDFSDHRETIITNAELLASALDCKLWFVHIVAPIMMLRL